MNEWTRGREERESERGERIRMAATGRFADGGTFQEGKQAAGVYGS